MPRMIRVRSKQSGLTAMVNERAFRHFAGDYERLDEPETPAPAPAAEPNPEPKPKSRGTAANKEEE
jgi:hypothetical protein